MTAPVENEVPNEALVSAEAAEPAENEAILPQEVAEDPFAKLQEDLSSLQDRYLRMGAEFENFKKRSERERQSSVRFASEGLLHELLPVLDHLEQALSAAEMGSQGAEAKGYNNIVLGVKMVLKQFQDVLGRFGVQTFSALGQVFDPTKHEAVSERETEEVPAGHVLEEFQKGYMLHERLVRPARVVVAKKPS